MLLLSSNCSKLHINLDLGYIDLICNPDIHFNLAAKWQMSSGPQTYFLFIGLHFSERKFHYAAIRKKKLAFA